MTSFALDPEIAAALAALAEGHATPPSRPARGDWKSLRDIANANLELWGKLLPEHSDVATTTFWTKAPDGTEIELRWYRKRDSEPGSAVVFAHGGGLVAGSLDIYDPVVADLAHRSGVPFLSVQYRTAPVGTGVIPAEDAFAGICWLVEHAAMLNVDPKRIAGMADSGGGAVMAGASILARDRRVRLARQIFIYPMLDDRSPTPDSHLEPFLTWNYDSNFTGWSALLGADIGSDAVSPVAAPARLIDFSGLPPTYIEVGELDLFRDEDVAYATQLSKAGVSVELHVHPGAPHGFDRFAPNSQLALRAMDDRVRVLQSF